MCGARACEVCVCVCVCVCVRVCVCVTRPETPYGRTMCIQSQAGQQQREGDELPRVSPQEGIADTQTFLSLQLDSIRPLATPSGIETP